MTADSGMSEHRRGRADISGAAVSRFGPVLPGARSGMDHDRMRPWVAGGGSGDGRRLVR